ncbi:hypothetical protein ACTWPF_01035 [Oceanobacillus sp. M65]|uniref:hypothetical protein n=1 Tax=Oceanobacillus sp. M65 TaxID=3457435 RepID=UPI003FCCC0CB
MVGRNTVVMALAVEKSGDITEVAAADDVGVMPIVAQAITEKKAVTLAADRYLNKLQKDSIWWEDYTPC